MRGAGVSRFLAFASGVTPGLNHVSPLDSGLTGVGTPSAKSYGKTRCGDDVVAVTSAVNSGVESCKSFRFGVDGGGYPRQYKSHGNIHIGMMLFGRKRSCDPLLDPSPRMKAPSPVQLRRPVRCCTRRPSTRLFYRRPVVGSVLPKIHHLRRRWQCP